MVRDRVRDRIHKTLNIVPTILFKMANMFADPKLERSSLFSLFSD